MRGTSGIGRYYNGDHDLGFASARFERAFGQLFKEFALNYCEALVDTLVDRLVVTGFDVEGKKGPASIGDECDTIWRRNRLDLRSTQTHSEAIKVGDAYVIVWPGKDGLATFYPNKPDGIALEYDEETPGLIRMAVKIWRPRDRKFRMTVYTADFVYRFIGREVATSTALPKKADAFEPLRTADEAWPIENTFRQVPVFPFANRAGIDEYGASELRSVLPVQDALNKGVMDWLVAQEVVALPQRYATGIEIPTNAETGKVEDAFKAAMDSVWASRDKDSRFGQFPGADLSGLLKGNDSLVGALAVISRTPMHYMLPVTGNWPSGESLKTAESGLIAKANGGTLRFGNAWEDAMRFALKVDSIGGADEVQLSTQWEETAPRSENDIATRTKTYQSAGAALKAAARRAGMSENDAEELAEAELDDLRQSPTPPQQPAVPSVPGNPTTSLANGTIVQRMPNGVVAAPR